MNSKADRVAYGERSGKCALVRALSGGQVAELLCPLLWREAVFLEAQVTWQAPLRVGPPLRLAPHRFLRLDGY